MSESMHPQRADYLALTPLFDNALLNACGDGDNTMQLQNVFDAVADLMVKKSPFNQRFPRILRGVAKSYKSGETQAIEHFSDPTHIRFMLTDVVEFLDSTKAKTGE